MIRFAKAIMVNAHSIACVLLAGYVFALVMRFGHAVWVWGLGLGLGFGRYGFRGRMSERGG
jgi:4-amino-4-deoxy-L-arabinose transferase-like glycosyltransferase